ncbi:MAG: transcription-repair coupling factor, partial [Yaniella sp.]|nr:transcription-repair coupling factor [Yaniella sp.]
HLPHDYIPGERLRLEAYRNLAQAADAEAVAAVVEELQDRYGKLPEPAENLVAVANFRNTAREYGIYEVMLMGKNIKFGPMESLPDSRAMRLKRMYPGATHRAPMKALMVPRPKTKSVTGKDLVDADLLQWAGDFIAHVFGEN